MDPALMRTAGGYRSDVVEAVRRAPLEVEDVPAPRPVEADADGFSERPAYTQEQPALAAEEAVEAPPEDEPAGEECDEATFFIEQGLFDEAREILETVLIAYPDHQRAAQLLSQVEQGQAAQVTGGPSSDEEPSTGPQHANGEARSAFDLAAELANELGELGSEEAPQASSAGGGDYQVSVEEVFAEFKKGLEKVVKPEDVETHYDLGIAYKEMGLADDAISEFTIARKGCIGKKKEVDCLTMVGLLQILKGDYPMAIEAFQQALASEHSVGDVEKATRYELGAAFEGAGNAGRALAQFQRVQAIDPHFRDVAAYVARLSAIAVPEEDPPPSGGPAPRKGGPGGSGGGAPSRKVGYV
jgi:pilus assembly protein FimV